MRASARRYNPLAEKIVVIRYLRTQLRTPTSISVRKSECYSPVGQTDCSSKVNRSGELDRRQSRVEQKGA